MNQFIKTCFLLKKTFTYVMLSLVVFFLNQSLTNLFHDIGLTFFLQINLVLLLGFKVINVKKLHSENVKH